MQTPVKGQKEQQRANQQIHDRLIFWQSEFLHQQWLQVYANSTTGCQNPRTPPFFKGDRDEQSKNMKVLWWQTIIIRFLITLYDIIFQWVRDNCTLLIIVTEISAEHEFYFLCHIIESATPALNVVEWSHPHPFYWVTHHPILTLLASPGTLPNIMGRGLDIWKKKIQVPCLCSNSCFETGLKTMCARTYLCMQLVRRNCTFANIEHYRQECHESLFGFCLGQLLANRCQLRVPFLRHNAGAWIRSPPNVKLKTAPSLLVLVQLLDQP
jgi:hypothetical protein